MKYDDRPDAAKRLETARIARGFKNPRQAANYFGWSYESYIQHESGLRGLSRAAAKYAKAYRVSEAWLLTGEGEKPGEEFPKTEEGFIKEVSRLSPMTENNIIPRKLDQLIAILSRMAPPAPKPIEAEKADCFVWNPHQLSAEPVKKVNRIDISLIAGVDNVRDILVNNTKRFAKGLPANNALLWGARGMGKSSLIKATQALINKQEKDITPLKLIEIHRENIDTLPLLMNELIKSKYRFILFCDDLSFDRDDISYKSLKTILDGGVEGCPANILFYATSNRRHLMPRDIIENEHSTAINPSEAIEEKVSLSDRFGLWLGFHACSQDNYLTMVENYARYYHLEEAPEKIRKDALEWAMTRGNRSGRVAWQFIQDMAGRLGKTLD